ncbi:MAG: efflux RND transporter permease subunit, partial [Planctomycetota bacterium]
TFNLLAGAAAVAAVIFLMMGWRAAAVVLLALPLTSLIVLFGMWVSGIPIHQMSVTGLIIALGLLIDNAIVSVDEVKARLSLGRGPAAAVREAVSHLAIPLLGSTLTTVFAFAPIALMPGAGGEFVGAIALGVIMAVFASLALSLTVLPAVAARLLPSGGKNGEQGEHEQPRGLFRRVLKDGIPAGPVGAAYRRALGLCLRRPWVGVTASVALPVCGFLLAGTLREQFFPPSDRNQFHVQLDLPTATALERTRVVAGRVDDLLRAEGPERVEWLFGDSGPEFYYNVVGNRRGQPGFAQAFVTLPAGQDPIPVIRRLQAAADRAIPSARTLVRQLEQGPPFEAPVEVRLFGPDLATLRALGEEIRARVNNHPNVVAVRTDLSE